ncbi:unnamed protein product, partial [Polarella glacialis]
SSPHASPHCSPRGSHFFGDDLPAPKSPRVDPEKVKQELKLKKKLREIEDLDKRLEAGEKLEPNQQTKLDGKEAVLEELRLLTSDSEHVACTDGEALELQSLAREQEELE